MSASDPFASPGSPDAPVKPLAQSTTAQAVVLVYVGAIVVAWPVLQKLIHGQPTSGEELTAFAGACATLIGGAFALYGRVKATSKIAGLLSVPADMRVLRR